MEYIMIGGVKTPISRGDPEIVKQGIKTKGQSKYAELIAAVCALSPGDKSLDVRQPTKRKGILIRNTVNGLSSLPKASTCKDKRKLAWPLVVVTSWVSDDPDNTPDGPGVLRIWMDERDDD